MIVLDQSNTLVSTRTVSPTAQMHFSWIYGTTTTTKHTKPGLWDFLHQSEV